MNLVLVALQTDQPPACQSHTQRSHETTEDDAQDRIAPTAATDRHAEASGCEDDEEDGEPQVQRPRMVLQVATEDWEETEDFDTEQREAENVSCAGKTRGQHRTGHQGGIGR